ncbi:hypothetical protein [Amaricoccus sp. W119]|uniref:hypothetical protein n=1 Tax=Amaricoccus sp. W119 TaxID=3391833 RepID=UPI0039A6BD91
MAATLAAACVYSLFLLIIRLIGNLLRVFLLAPMIGHALTAMLELPVILLIAWTASRVLIQIFGMRRNLPHAALMGALTFVMLVAGEAVVAVIAGESVTSILRSYGRAPAWLGLLGAFILAFFPAIQVALSRSMRR